MRLIKNYGIDVKTDHEKTIATAAKNKSWPRKSKIHIWKKQKLTTTKQKPQLKKRKTGYEKTKATAEEAKIDYEKTRATIGKPKRATHNKKLITSDKKTSYIW